MNDIQSATGRDQQVRDGSVREQTANTNQAPKIARKITIEPVNHGFVVQIDCQTIAVESANKLIGLLGAYLTDPAGAEARYNNGTLL